MSRGRYAPGIPGRAERWHISVHDATNTRLIFHAVCEDEKEIQALATEARSQCLRFQIWITPPSGRVRSWD